MLQWPLPKRLDFIRQLSSNSKIGQHQLQFQGRVSFYDVFIVDIEFPCYRLSNGRTKAAQKELIVKENLPEDFFDVDPDSTIALERQHEILKSLITKGKDAIILKILRDNEQTQPLILDSDGYVVNGNRRLCAMRTLLEEDPDKFSKYQHIQVMFLPPCTESDIKDLEFRLQWQPDGWSDYDWINKALALRDCQQQSWTMERICDVHKMSRPEVQQLIAMLEDAEAYLEDRGKSFEYSAIVDRMHAFEQLQKNRRKCGDNEPKKQLFTAISYVMIDDPAAAGTRLYESIPDAFRFLDNINDQLNIDFEDEISALPENPNDLGGIFGEEPMSQYQKVCDLLRYNQYFPKIREVVRDKIEEMRVQERERKDSEYCIRETRKAYTAVVNAKSNFQDGSITEGIDNLLENIVNVCQEFRSILSNGNN